MTTVKLLVLMVNIIYCFSDGYTLPVPDSKTILINPDTVKYYASFIHPSTVINDLTIAYGTGYSDEVLLRVPIAAPGELLPQAMIRITVGMNPPATDSDPIIGISDGVNNNQYQLVETASSTTRSVNPCEIFEGSDNGRRAPHGNIVAGTYVLVFDPIHNFGTCSTNNGFSTAGKFDAHVDPSKGLNLVLQKSGSSEEYAFHYFLIEFL